MSLILVLISYVIWYTLGDGFSDSFQILEKRAESEEERRKWNSRWKFWQAFRQGGLFVMVGLISGDWTFVLVCISSFWLFHNMIVNLTALKVEWWYLGTTSNIDVFIRKILVYEVMIPIFKVGFLVISLILFHYFSIEGHAIKDIINFW